MPTGRLTVWTDFLDGACFPNTTLDPYLKLSRNVHVCRRSSRLWWLKRAVVTTQIKMEDAGKSLVVSLHTHRNLVPRRKTTDGSVSSLSITNMMKILPHEIHLSVHRAFTQNELRSAPCRTGSLEWVNVSNVFSI